MNQTFITREQLLILLDSLSSSDNLLRTQSEANLKEAQKLNGIGVELTKISLDSSLPVHLRQVKRSIKELNFFFFLFYFSNPKVGSINFKKICKRKLARRRRFFCWTSNIRSRQTTNPTTSSKWFIRS